MAEPLTETSFYHVYGFFIARWNGLESAFKMLLQTCAGGGPAAEILIEQMTNRERATALLNMIRRHERSHLEPAISHAVAYFERLEQHRNYYVHEVRHYGTIDPETDQYAALSSTSKLQRDGINVRTAIVKVAEIHALSDHCAAAGDFISEIARHLMKMPEGWLLTPLEPFPNLPAVFGLGYRKADEIRAG